MRMQRNVLVADIKFYKIDSNGNEILTKDGKNIQLYELKRDIKSNSLKNLCKDVDEGMLQEIENAKK